MFFTKSLLLSFNNNNFFNISCIPIPKYKEYKIEKVINKSYKFDLDIKKIKKGSFIYLDYLRYVIPEIEPLYCSIDNIKNEKSFPIFH